MEGRLGDMTLSAMSDSASWPLSAEHPQYRDRTCFQATTFVHCTAGHLPLDAACMMMQDTSEMTNKRAWGGGAEAAARSCAQSASVAE